jgi:uncharacterized protein YcbK (DUF882 family)
MSLHMPATELITSRRTFLKSGFTLSLSALMSVGSVTPALALPSGGTYNVDLRNEHTGETFSGAYRVGNKYLPEAFERINYVLRDFRTNEVFPIDPRAIDIIAIVHRATGSPVPYSVISGYRSPQTNRMLRSSSEGVAKRSLHMSGQAVDVRLKDINPKHIRDLAVKLRAGGVGYYAKSGFVHLDSGDFRTW